MHTRRLISRRPLVTLALLAASLCVAQPPLATPETHKQTERSHDAERFADLLARLAKHDKLTLGLPPGDSPPGAFDVSLVLGEEQVTAALVRHSLRAASFQVLDDRGGGALVPVDPGPVRTYRGTLVERPEARVAATLRPDATLIARIALSDATWYVEPAIRAGAAEAAPTSHIGCRRDALLRSAGTCGVESGAQPAEDPIVTRGSSASSAHYRAQIAFDADYEYYDEYRSTGAAVGPIETNINQAGDICERDVAICYEVTAIIVRTSSADPYSDTEDADPLLTEMTMHWRGQPHGHSALDDASDDLQAPDRHDHRAGLGRRDRVQRGERLAVLGVWPPGGHLGPADRTALCAHEIGHNWNACHCNLSACGVVDPCGIMTSVVGGRDCFSQLSQNQIEARRNLMASCQLAMCGYGLTLLIPEFPFLTIENAVAAARCRTVISIRNGTYVLPTGVLNPPAGHTVRFEARGGTVVLDH